MEGEFAGVHTDDNDSDNVWFEVGGKKPPAREGLRFIVASSGAVYIPQHQFAGARRQFSGIGALVIMIETTEGVRISVGPQCHRRDSGQICKTKIVR